MSGCISVNLSPEKDLKSATGVNYTPPPSPFEEIFVSKSDHAWKNKTTNTLISYLSECGDVHALKIPDTASAMLRAQGLTLQTQKQVSLQGKDALESLAFQKDGAQKILVKVLSFKTKECLYNLVYLGAEKNFSKDLSVFQNFAEGFKGP
jgi:hypothetical protein